MVRLLATGCLAFSAALAVSALSFADDTVIEQRTEERVAPPRVVEERRVVEPPVVEKRTDTVVKSDNDNDNDNDRDVDVNVDVDD